jgi:cyclic pyranopterin phosphate synthase
VSAKGFTHFDEFGRPRMVDVSKKAETLRTAVACGSVRMSKKAFELAKSGRSKKGDAVAAAELAGIMGAKKTSDLIPLCHPLSLSGVAVETAFDDSKNSVIFTATVKTTGQTGVEMEALTAASVACLTLYDMLKSQDRTMTIENIALLSKSGGSSGTFTRDGSD